MSFEHKSVTLKNDIMKGNVYCSNIDIFNPNILTSVVIAEISDLHLENDEMIGKDNVDLVSMAIEYNGADIIMISGDIVNDALDLKNPLFCEKLREVIKSLSNGRLLLVQIGNHDIATFDKSSRCFKEMDSSLLKEALSPLPNIIFLDEINNLYLRNNQKIAQCGFEGLTHTNLNFVGLVLPWDYYFKNKENLYIFEMIYQEKIINNSPFLENTFNILDIHTIVNFIKLCRLYPHIFKDVDVCLGGHQHGGLVPAGLDIIIPSNRGLIAPNMKVFPTEQRGIELLDKENSSSKLVCSIGNSVNVRVEMPLINKLSIYGPSVRFIRLNEKGPKGMVKVKRTTLKFR